MCSADSFTPWHKNLHWVLYKMTETKISHPWLSVSWQVKRNLTTKVKLSVHLYFWHPQIVPVTSGKPTDSPCVVFNMSQGYRENVIRASGQGYGFKTTGQEQNRSIRKGHLTQQKKRVRESRLGVSKGYSRWHLVLAKLLSPIYWAYPLINKAEKQIQLSKVIVDNSLCFVHVWGNKSANYTGVDINGAPLKQRLSSERNTFPDELCIVPLLYHHVCHHHVHVHSVKNFLSTAN